MADIKTRPTDVSVTDYIAAVSDPVRRQDALELLEIMTELSGQPAQMWGPSIIGFGTYHYRYESGREGDMCRVGFSPRKSEMVLYVLRETEQEAQLLAKLGKHRTGKSCLYIKRLAQVDLEILKKIIRLSIKTIGETYPE